jgi:hypothetical protein
VFPPLRWDPSAVLSPPRVVPPPPFTAPRVPAPQCWSYDNFINHGMNEIFGKRAFSLWIMEKGLKTRLKTMERFSIIGP